MLRQERTKQIDGIFNTDPHMIPLSTATLILQGTLTISDMGDNALGKGNQQEQRGNLHDLLSSQSSSVCAELKVRVFSRD